LEWLEICYEFCTLIIEDAVEISWKLDKGYFGFGVDLISYSAAVFSM